MDAGNKSFSEFVTGQHSFEIPKYQRNFSWEEGQLEDLWRDLNQSIDAGREHFFGTFLLQTREGNAHDVIDGQQRLTSILILLDRLAKQWQRYDEEKAGEVRNWYVAGPGGYKLTLMGDDKQFFKEAILGGFDIDSETYTPEPETPSQRRLAQAATFFDEKLREKEVELGDEGFERYCEELYECVQNLDLMVYPVESEAEAVRTFEVANDRGKHLTDLEKTKSFLMHQLYLHVPDNHGEVLEEHLTQVRSNFGDIYCLVDEIRDVDDTSGISEDRVQRYHYILWDTEWKTGRDSRYYQNHLTHLKRKFRSYDEGSVEAVLDYAEELRDAFRALKRLANRETEERRVEERLDRLFVLGRLGNFYPLLVAAWLRYDREWESFDSADLVTLLDQIETFIFRVYSVQQRPGNTGRTRFYTLARKLHQREVDIEEAAQEVGAYIDKYCDVAHLRDELADTDVYGHYSDRKDELRYLLYFYEEHLESEMENLSFDLEDIVQGNDDITIEHIWPQNSSELDLTPEERETYDEYKHRLGNLALMTQPWNSSESNLSFSNKREAYADSKFRMLNEVAEHKEWGRQQIAEREEDLLDFVCERWANAAAE